MLDYTGFTTSVYQSGTVTMLDYTGFTTPVYHSRTATDARLHRLQNIGIPQWNTDRCPITSDSQKMVYHCETATDARLNRINNTEIPQWNSHRCSITLDHYTGIPQLNSHRCSITPDSKQHWFTGKQPSMPDYTELKHWYTKVEQPHMLDYIRWTTPVYNTQWDDNRKTECLKTENCWLKLTNCLKTTRCLMLQIWMLLDKK